MEHFSNLYTSMYSVSLQPDTDHSRLGTPGRPLDTGTMEVASLRSEDDPAPGGVTKRILQGRPLPAILVDNHPGSRYPSFRPHQRRPSLQKGVSGGREGASTPCDSGVSFSSPEGDPPHHASTTSKSSVRSNPRGGGLGTSPKKRKRRARPAAPLPPGLLSSTSSGVSSGRASEPPHSKSQHRIQTRMSQHGRSSYLDGPDYSVNPDPVPFMPSNFMSSTMVKKIPIPKRHQDTFGGYEYNFTGQRGVMLHTDRYQFEALRSFEGLNQRDRLLAEMAYLEHLRGIKRRREVVPHRAELDLFLGGKKIECEERFDINREIQRLKAMAMPTRARDLFHGRGIVLPPTHMSVLPRPPRVPVPEDSDSDEEVRVSAPASTRRAPAPPAQSPTYERQISLTLGEAPHTRSYIRGRRFQQLPSLTKTQTPRADLVDSGRRSPILLAKEKRTVTSLQARLKLPRMQRDDTNLSKSQASIPQTSRSAAWVEEQNQLLSLSRTGTPDTQGSFTGSLVGTRLELQVHLPPSSRADDLHLDLEREEEDEGQKSRISPSGPPRAQAEEDTPSVQQRQSGLQSVAATEKRLSPEAPPPSTEGRPRLPHGPRQTSPQKSHTPNPLKTGMDLDVSDEQVTNLRQTFQRLDTDMDGHLQYHQLKSQLPKEFSQQQEYFVKQVYEITSSSAVFFGVDEFMMMTQLTDRVASLTGPALEAYGKLNFDTLESAIIRYVDLFQAGDSSQRGRLSLETLRELIGRSQNKPPVDENSKVWNTIMDSLNLDYSSQVSRIEYLAHIPLFMAVAPPVLPPPEEQAGQPGLADKQ